MEQVMPLLITFLLGWLFGAILATADWQEDCPRVLLGYKCKGKGCDHSIREIKAAMEVRGANQFRQR